jgi:hypothetical protein
VVLHLGATYDAVRDVVLVEDQGSASWTRGRVPASGVEEPGVAQQKRAGWTHRDNLIGTRSFGPRDRDFRAHGW